MQPFKLMLVSLVYKRNSLVENIHRYPVLRIFYERSLSINIQGYTNPFKMKKSNFRTFLLICTISASVASYAFINTRQIDNIQLNTNVSIELPKDENREDVILPEVQLIKKILQKSREILPATHF